MNARLPFARGEDRLRLLYELPLPDGALNWLVLADSAAALQAVAPQDRPAQLTAWTPQAAAPPAGAYDVVALPGTLLAAAATAPLVRLRQAHAALRPGGVVVGHLEHLLSLRGVAGAARRGGWLWRWPAAQGVASAHLCERTLQRCGFVEAECFYVEPHIAAPMALVPSDLRAARSHFVRTVHRNRPLYTAPGFWARLALAQAFLGGTLQAQLFFWARKPC